MLIKGRELVQAFVSGVGHTVVPLSLGPAIMEGQKYCKIFLPSRPILYLVNCAIIAAITIPPDLIL